MEKGDKLWFLNNHTGKIEYIKITHAGKKNFSFQNKGRTYKAEYSSIGTRYYKTIDELMDKQRRRAELVVAEDEMPKPEEEADISIICADCGERFLFTVRDQKFYEEKGFTPPVRCKACRDKRKAAAGK